MNLIAHLRSKYAKHISDKCVERRCRLNLRQLSNYVNFMADSIVVDRKMCDCLVFTNYKRFCIAVVELKSGDIDASSIRDKLINGGKLAAEMLGKCNVQFSRKNFFLILLHNKRISTSEYVIITKRGINIGGISFDIIVDRCGASLVDIIERFG